MKKAVFTSLFLSWYMLSFSQISILQASGETSFLSRQNLVTINAKETSFGLIFEPKEYPATATSYFRITATVDAKNSTGSILKGGSLKLGGSVGGTFIHEIKHKADDYHYWFVGYDLSLSRYKIFDGARQFDDQLFDDSNAGHKFFLGLNTEGWTKWNLFGGVSISGGWRNNASLIDPIDVTQIQRKNLYYSPDSTKINQVTNQSKEAYLSDSFRRNLSYWRVNSDIGFTMTKRINTVFHLRCLVDQQNKPAFNAGLGFYLHPKGAPLESVVGLQLMANDWAGSRVSPETKDKSLWSRTSLNLVAAFKL